MPPAQLLPRHSFRSTVLSEFSDLPSVARLVLVALDDYRSDKSPVPYPSQGALCDDTGLALRTVRDALAIAQERGWCYRTKRVTTRGKRLTDAYVLMVPDEIAARAAAVQGHRYRHLLPGRGAPAAGLTPAPPADELSIPEVTNEVVTKPPRSRERRELTTRDDTPTLDELFGDL